MHATNAFYTALVKVPGYTTEPFTVVAQKVQRSGFPEAYARHEPDARVLASALTGQSPAALSCGWTTPSGRGAARGSALSTGSPREQAAVHGRPARRRPGRPPGRHDPTLAWSLAQWSVGSAERFGVARVYVDGRVWDHRKPDDGWRRRPTAAAGSSSCSPTPPSPPLTSPHPATSWESVRLKAFRRTNPWEFAEGADGAG